MIETLLSPIIFSAVAQFVGPIARNLIPSNIDTANSQFRQKDFEARERQFQAQIMSSRDNLRLQFEHQKNNIDYQKKLENWPLHISPINILEESQKRSSYALNVIINVVDNNDADYYRNAGRYVSQTIDTINTMSFSLAEQASLQFGEDMVCYCEARKSARFRGDGLRTTLSSFLSSEPTILIEVRVPHADHIEFHISHWGFPSETNRSYTRYKPQTFGLRPHISSPDVTMEENLHLEQARGVTVGLALAGLIVSVGDAFRMLQRPYGNSVPVFPSLMSDPSFGMLPLNSMVPEALWKPIRHAYLETYDSVASLNKNLASELAAKAASTAHKESQVDFANQLLDKSVRLHPQILNDDEIQLTDVLRRQRVNDIPSELERALTSIRGWSPIGGDSAAQARPSIRELALINKAKLLKTSKKEFTG